ncbi:hypothetical protein ACT80S_18565 [Ramlibacter sp. MAHUQ-53]|uniref:hypothetical protein n=1 Tax=unclassified Ramlibacter TaxID=2617605 RepID=UPI003642D8DA
MKLAWIENDRIRDIAPGNPAELYHPDIAAYYATEVPDDAENGDGWVNGQLVKPAPVAPVVEPPAAPVFAKVSPVEFKLLFTPQERVAIKLERATDPVIDDFFDIVDDPRLTHVDLGLQSTQDALSYLVAQGLVTAERRTAILSGALQ